MLEGSIKNIGKSDSNFTLTFVDHHLLQKWILMDIVQL